MKKRLFAGLALCLALVSMTCFAYAADETEAVVVEHYTTEDGIEVETTLTVHENRMRASYRSAEKETTYKSEGKVIAIVKLEATFGYDGKTAWVEEAGSDHTTYDGWSYGSEKISTSGNTAKLTAIVKKAGVATVPVSISMTCTPTGSIS